MFRRLCLILGLILLCFNAAAKAPVIPTPIAQELPVELVLSQQELSVDVPDTASMMGAQFGLIGSLIGSAVQNSQTKKAEDRLVPLRDLLLQYRFNERLEAAVRAKLASEGISPNPQLIVRPTPWDAAEANAEPVAAQTLVIVPHYAMSVDFQELNVSLMTSLVERTRKPNGKYKTKLLFSRNYPFVFRIAPQDDEDMVLRWSALGTAGLSTLLDQGIGQVTDMLVHDFSPAGRAEWAITGKKQKIEQGGRVYQGQTVRQGNGWVWLRWGKGWVHSLTGRQLLDQAAIATLTAPTAPAATTAPAANSAATPAEGAAAPVGSGG